MLRRRRRYYASNCGVRDDGWCILCCELRCGDMYYARRVCALQTVWWIPGVRQPAAWCRHVIRVHLHRATTRTPTTGKMCANGDTHANLYTHYFIHALLAGFFSRSMMWEVLSRNSRKRDCDLRWWWNERTPVDASFMCFLKRFTIKNDVLRTPLRLRERERDDEDEVQQQIYTNNFFFSNIPFTGNF